MLAEYPTNRREKTTTYSHNNRTPITHKNHRQIDAHKQRVTQTNMVYLIGLPEDIADQQTLASYQYCGQYGQIIKILVKKNYFNDFASYSAYVTYTTDEAASIAILGINNLLYGRARIYASYGTNKYCATFIKFGKCKKSDCPFFHRIEEQKEIRQQDNKKLFQDQQLLAKSYVVKNYPYMQIIEETDSNAFPCKSQIIQSLIQQGSIKIKKESKTNKQICQIVERTNALKESVSARSQISTQCSPAKTLDYDYETQSPILIIPKIQRKLNCSGKSILGFHKGQSRQIQQMTKLILSALETDY